MFYVYCRNAIRKFDWCTFQNSKQIFKRSSFLICVISYMESAPFPLPPWQLYKVHYIVETSGEHNCRISEISDMGATPRISWLGASVIINKGKRWDNQDQHLQPTSFVNGDQAIKGIHRETRFQDQHYIQSWLQREATEVVYHCIDSHISSKMLSWNLVYICLVFMAYASLRASLSVSGKLILIL